MEAIVLCLFVLEMFTLTVGLWRLQNEAASMTRVTSPVGDAPNRERRIHVQRLAENDIY